MNADEFLKKVIEYNADEKGIRDRFGSNTELYKICFFDFLKEPNFKLLREAISAKDYKQAFESAHALKGISGNLGLTDFYNSTCVLVNALHENAYNAVPLGYANVMQQYERLIYNF